MRWPDHPDAPLTQRQREYVLGAVLGDDSLQMNAGSVNAHLRTQQSLAHQSYLKWKYDEMKDHTRVPPRLIRNPRYDRLHWTVRFHTRATPELTTLYRLCYPRGRKAVSEDWLRQLTAFSPAVWYMDDGTYAPGPGRHFCMLYTGAFPYAQQLLINRYLQTQWGVTGCVIQHNRRQWCLRFTRLGTQQLLKIVEPYVTGIPSMRYKLGWPEQRWKQPVQEAMNRWLYAWRQSEDAVLRQRYGRAQARTLAQRLQRTLNAVRLRARKLGLDGRQADRVRDGSPIYN